ncbi:MAG: DUF389 domain-containing protein [Pyrinomonadaceae bacterium]
MSSAEQTARDAPVHQHLRDWFARNLGVGPERKEEIYLEVTQSASLRDVSYWLQVLFSAGIATLGLVLNSPAVIIGAMLISPLMGPILANGLALAAGDLVLGVRAIITLLLSCVVAVALAMLLVYLLPFKEQTAEIVGRTHPNTLDLIVALFSGAVGSVAICKRVKGVVTSIPGVAIAVALMPPLCVVGFGLGVAVSQGGVDGMKVARGGGLLFLTNLVAITFTAMLVFLALHIDTQSVRERVRAWRTEEDEAGRWLRDTLNRLPGAERLRKVGSLPGRILLILVIILLIFIPLSRSFSQLRNELAQKQSENRIRRAATEIWEQKFAKLPGGGERSYLGQLTMSDQDGKLSLLLRVFTIKPFTADERAEYARMVAERVGRPASSVNAQLIEIPTASSELLTKAREAPREEKHAEAAITVAQLQKEFAQGVETSLAGQRLPPPARLVNYEVMLRADAPLQLRLLYLSEREIGADAQNLIAENIRTQFDDPSAEIKLERIEDSFGPLAFDRNRSTISKDVADTLNRIGQILSEQPKLRVEIAASAEQNEREGVAAERAQALTDYLTSNYQLASDRIKIVTATDGQQGAMLSIKPGEVSR